MNRVKVWVFTVIVVALGFALARAAMVSRRSDAIVALDARLATAAAFVAASAKGLAREAGAAAAGVARDGRLVAALAAHESAAPPPPRGKKGKAPPPLPRRDPASDEAMARDAARRKDSEQ